MNKTKVIYTLLILLLTALPLLSSCQSIIPAQAKAVESEAAINVKNAAFDYG